MDAGHITPGVICDRSIEDISPKSLLQYDRVHMFAGIAGWELALKHAGWGNRRVWTGSCPCQPFSAAGKGAGFDDQRHLWPAWFHLIRECRPAVIFGEQVASKDAEPWVDLVHADLETVGYAFGCVPFPAAGIGAPQLRDRAYWVAHSDGRHASAERKQPRRQYGQQPKNGDADFWGASVWRVCSDGQSRPVEPGALPLCHGIPARVARLRAYGNAIVPQAAAEFIASFLDIEQWRVREGA